MLLMPTSEPRNLIRQMSISRHVCSCLEAARRTVSQSRPVLLFHKTFIRKHIKPMEPLVHQLHGEDPLLRQIHKGLLLQDLVPVVGEVGVSRRSTHRLSRQIHMSGTIVVHQDQVQLPHLRVDQVLDKNNRCAHIKVLAQIEVHHLLYDALLHVNIIPWLRINKVPHLHRSNKLNHLLSNRIKDHQIVCQTQIICHQLRDFLLLLVTSTVQVLAQVHCHHLDATALVRR